MAIKRREVKYNYGNFYGSGSFVEYVFSGEHYTAFDENFEEIMKTFGWEGKKRGYDDTYNSKIVWIYDFLYNNSCVAYYRYFGLIFKKAALGVFRPQDFKELSELEGRLNED